MFGGPKLDILFVTSMAKPPLPRFPGDGLLRGSLFAIYAAECLERVALGGTAIGGSRSLYNIVGGTSIGREA